MPLTHTGDNGWIFNLVCPGNAHRKSHENLLLLKNATVNRNLGFDDVCKEKYAFVAYSNQEGLYGRGFGGVWVEEEGTFRVSDMNISKYELE